MTSIERFILWSIFVGIVFVNLFFVYEWIVGK